MSRSQWQIPTKIEIPAEFIAAVKKFNPAAGGEYLAKLLWQRGIQDLDRLPGFLDRNLYQSSDPFAFGAEMKLAVARLENAFLTGEKVTIWGDFDADGITATSVLKEGLGQFFPGDGQLNYYIPDRDRESHGLNIARIKKLSRSGTKLIVTCDTGSTNIEEIDYATDLGIDIIITDHHTLPPQRPEAIAIINPRYFPLYHPLYHLSGVAVAYKLIEALYQTFPHIPQQPLEELLDLVAIGLIADVVELSGDCRYLAQIGIEQLKKQTINPTRPGVAELLKLCQRNGDRPTDISFGIGPRINAVSRIKGDAKDVVELLTSRDRKRCKELAEDTELANTRRKSLQQHLTKKVKQKLASIDLSTTSAIVLEDPQWEASVLGLVAGEIARVYGRPTILLTSGYDRLARGSARSINNIDLYELVKSQANLLDRFGGHPLAAGLSLPLENLPLFQQGIDRQLRQQIDPSLIGAIIEVDLTVTVAELGQNLFKELKAIEPCGAGNPAPKLLIKNCWFKNLWNQNIKDRFNRKVQYIKTTFTIWDDTVKKGFPGIWWGHYQYELPQTQLCDAIIELDFNPRSDKYEARLIDVKSSQKKEQITSNLGAKYLIDRRGKLPEKNQVDSNYRLLEKCPINWNDISQEYQKAIDLQKKLALTYSLPEKKPPQQIWQELVGIAKYLSRTNKQVTSEQIKTKLQLSDRSLELGFQALETVGFSRNNTPKTIQISHSGEQLSYEAENIISLFLRAVAEEQFQYQYFYTTSVSTLEKILTQQR